MGACACRLPWLQNEALRSSTLTHEPSLRGSTLDAMRAVMRGLGWVIVVAALAAAGAAVGSAALRRRGTRPGTTSPRRGSFDAWPTVPPAPGRLVANGPQVPSGT
jgi:hypothetical protein